MQPISLEEQLICYADLFFAKTRGCLKSPVIPAKAGIAWKNNTDYQAIAGQAHNDKMLFLTFWTAPKNEDPIEKVREKVAAWGKNSVEKFEYWNKIFG